MWTRRWLRMKLVWACMTLWMALQKRKSILQVFNANIFHLTVSWPYFYTGEYKTILQLVGVLSHGKIAKRLTDRAVDLMQDVQNLRKAIYEFVTIPWYINIARLIRVYSSLYLATNWRLTHVKKAPSRRRNCGLLQSIICELSIKIESAASDGLLDIATEHWLCSPTTWSKCDNLEKGRKLHSPSGYANIEKSRCCSVEHLWINLLILVSSRCWHTIVHASLLYPWTLTSLYKLIYYIKIHTLNIFHLQFKRLRCHMI